MYAVDFVFAFFVGTPYALLDWRTFLAHVSAELAHVRMGHGVDLGLGWFYHASMTLPGGLGWPLFVAAIGRLAALAIRVRCAMGVSERSVRAVSSTVDSTHPPILPLRRRSTRARGPRRGEPISPEIVQPGIDDPVVPLA